ncbi:winged helix-turn-helix transcriptional regulator [Streptomyces sp. ISL-66]|uniref:ArsR/SmtB family transcription factor n=1 Tax=Streptomyces sp. ISL-66 TaxID=2819186 RepID=UPI001BE506CC|nr:DUF5937 family protein [Streptomyces sp. ISL-66]MBT2472174.1 winged helix-turn-helix transcriptional regulator [Streptomyces sp. ISL-66]
MGEVLFGVDDMANLRFAMSPLWETAASLRAVADPGRHAVHLPWIKEALALRQDRSLAGKTEPLHALVARDGTVRSFLTPPPRCPLAEMEEELATLAALPAEGVRAGLEAVGRRTPLTDFERRLADDPVRVLPELADAVLAWWQAGVRPYWPRIRAVLEADVAYRTRQLGEDGIREVLAHLHPALHWADNRLVSADLPAGELGLDGGGITLAPSAFAVRCHLLTGQGGAPPCTIYPSRAVGTLWERRDAAGDGLARLLGRSRAQVLAHTSSPSTTTRLAGRTGLSLGAVSQHLAVLRDAGLVTSHRYRREVHYKASDLGIALLERV